MLKRIIAIVCLLITLCAIAYGANPATERSLFYGSSLIGYNASTGIFSLKTATADKWLNGLGQYLKIYSDNVTEGTNLYWTQARFNMAFANMITDNLTQGTARLYVPSSGTGWLYSTDNFYPLYADNITQGATNRFVTISTAPYWYNGTNNWFTIYTDNITQGANKWYTDALARAAISVDTTVLSYSSSTGVITHASPASLDNLTLTIPLVLGWKIISWQ